MSDCGTTEKEVFALPFADTVIIFLLFFPSVHDKRGLDIVQPSVVSHTIMQGKVITDATLERRVSISPSSVSVANRLRTRFLPMFHLEESRFSEYCA